MINKVMNLLNKQPNNICNENDAKKALAKLQLKGRKKWGCRKWTRLTIRFHNEITNEGREVTSLIAIDVAKTIDKLFRRGEAEHFLQNSSEAYQHLRGEVEHLLQNNSEPYQLLQNKKEVLQLLQTDNDDISKEFQLNM